MDQLSAEQLLMVRATARVHVPCQGQALSRLTGYGPPEESLDEELGDISPRLRAPARSDSRVARAVRRIGATLPRCLLRAELSRVPATRIQVRTTRGPALDNGYGGVSPDGDYIIRVSSDRVPPAPWANVIANPHGGLHGDRARRRVHLGREQLLLPAHSVAQRSGGRPRERSDLSAGRDDRRAMVGDPGTCDGCQSRPSRPVVHKGHVEQVEARGRPHDVRGYLAATGRRQVAPAAERRT